MTNEESIRITKKVLNPAQNFGKKGRKVNAHLLSDVQGHIQNRHWSIEEYLQHITGLKGHFTLLESGKNKVTIFRRLSFIPPDDLAMVRFGLSYEVNPKIQSSFSNGFLVGEVRVDKKGRITKGLDANRRALLDYLLKEHMGAHVVEKLGVRLFKIHYPGGLVEILIARAAQITGVTPVGSIKNHRWHISVGNIGFEVERFLESCLVSATLTQFLSLINADLVGRERFIQISRPCLLVAFGRTIDVAGTRYYPAERQNLLSDRAFWHLLYAYEPISKDVWNAFLFSSPLPTGKSVKPVFLAGKRIKLSPRWILPEITTLSVPGIEISELYLKTKPVLCDSQPAFQIPSCPGQDLFRVITHQQYEYLRGCVMPRPVECRLGGRCLVGRVSAVDQTIYPPVWSMDHFFNCFAMIDFDLPLAKSMILGGLINYMELTGEKQGQLALTKSSKVTTTYPIWAPLIQRYFSLTGDRKFLKQVWPFLKFNDRYLDRFYLRDGIYVGAGGAWNDYSRGPKELPFVAGIGMNSLIALQKKVIFELGAELGMQDERFCKDFENLKAQINKRFWDERLGFYFDYDNDSRQIYTTVRGSRFFGLDNLLPLFAGIVPEDRIERITYYLTSSRYYGKYPAITTDLSDDFMDEWRLMVWVMNNWLVIQGLRNYRQHTIADVIARRIFNAFLKSWHRECSLPEALSGLFGLAPMENGTLAGVGCWSGFYLYLKESLYAQFKDRK